MSIFNCPFGSCAFFSSSSHGVEVHCSIVHNTCSNPHDTTGSKSATVRKGHISRRLVGSKRSVEVCSSPNEFIPDLPENNSTYDPLKEARNDIKKFRTLNGDNTDPKTRVAEENEIFTIDLCEGFFRLRELISERDCNELLGLLKFNASVLPSFLSKYNNMEAIRRKHQLAFKETTSQRGFLSHNFLSKNNIISTIYIRNPIDALKEQIRSCSKHDFKHTFGSENIVSNPFNAKIGSSACLAVQRRVSCSQSVNVSWKADADDGVESTVGCLQTFSDKSQTSLAAGSLKFYPLHVTLLNIEEERRRQLIISGNTVVAYLPVSMQSSNSSLSVNTDFGGEDERIAKLRILETLHELIEFALEPLHEVAERGIAASTNDDKQFLIHLFLTSYIADLPETEDLLSLKRGSQTYSPCHICLAKRDTICDSTNARRRNLKETKHLLSSMNSPKEKEKVHQTLISKSMHPYLPILSHFPFVGIHSSVDIYAIFRLEPMHVLSLGISKLLKECLLNMVGDPERKTSSSFTSRKQEKSYKQMRKSVISNLNLFLKRTEKSSPGFGLRLDFSKGENEGFHTGLFSENGLIGMLQASDYDSVDQVSPFLGSIVDMMCGNTETAEVTNVFTKFVELVQFTYREDAVSEWNSFELKSLDEKIRDFKRLGKRIFGAYQASKMGTQKWHLLDHLSEQIGEIGGIQFMHAGLYEGSHKAFKSLYEKTSKRRRSAMDETVMRLNMRIGRSLLCTNVSRKLGSTNPAKAFAMLEDCSVLVRSGAKTCLASLEALLPSLSSRQSEYFLFDGTDDISCQLVNRLQEDGLRSLCRLLNEHFETTEMSSAEARSTKLLVPSSCYVPGISCPKLSNAMDDDAVVADCGRIRFLQRAVAANKFYGSSEGRFDSILVTKSWKRMPTKNAETRVRCWAGKILCFIRICEEIQSEKSCHNHAYLSCPFCYHRANNELCFLQWYEVLSSQDAPIDAIEKCLNCVRLRWQRSPGTVGQLSSSKKYGLVPVESIRSVIHVVEKDTRLCSNNKLRPQRIPVNGLLDASDGWEAQEFYINRFYRGNWDRFLSHN